VRNATTPLHAVAWGALIGPVWAVVGTLVAAIAARGVIFGAVQGGSLFGFLLLGGAILGGLGGFLALSRAGAPEAAPA
jgi:hypothetical protein